MGRRKITEAKMSGKKKFEAKMNETKNYLRPKWLGEKLLRPK